MTPKTVTVSVAAAGVNEAPACPAGDETGGFAGREADLAMSGRRIPGPDARPPVTPETFWDATNRPATTSAAF